MTSLFLGCFAFGLLFTLTTFALGVLGGSHFLHLPSLGGLLGGHGDGAHGAGGAGVHAAGHPGAELSPLNLSTLSAFLTWFGGAGYLLMRYSHLTAVLTLALAAVAGMAGGGIIFVALAKFLLPRLTEMRPEDYRVPGTVARVTSAIRAGGTGEIVYTLGGAQQVEGARVVSGEALEQGAEVVILRIENGIAYVERWEKFAEEHKLRLGQTGPA